MAHASHSMMSKDVEQCIQECLNCYSMCTATAAYCLDMGGKHASRQHQTTLLDCATICQTSADFMLRGSPMHAQVWASAPTRAARASRSAGAWPTATR